MPLCPVFTLQHIDLDVLSSSFYLTDNLSCNL